MGDLFDQASEIEELFRDTAIAAARVAPRPPSTHCRNCNERLIDRYNYCDEDCRDDHTRRTSSGARTLQVLDSE